MRLLDLRIKLGKDKISGEELKQMEAKKANIAGTTVIEHMRNYTNKREV